MLDRTQSGKDFLAWIFGKHQFSILRKSVMFFGNVLAIGFVSGDIVDLFTSTR